VFSIELTVPHGLLLVSQYKHVAPGNALMTRRESIHTDVPGRHPHACGNPLRRESPNQIHLRRPPLTASRRQHQRAAVLPQRASVLRLKLVWNRVPETPAAYASPMKHVREVVTVRTRSGAIAHATAFLGPLLFSAQGQLSRRNWPTTPLLLQQPTVKLAHTTALGRHPHACHAARPSSRKPVQRPQS
jgi:hypothetical protein